MPPEMIIVPAVFFIPAAVLALRMWFRHREKMAELSAGKRSPDADDRLARLEHAVDAIAVEMERVGEGQRFLTKVLAERVPESARELGSKVGRVNTPH
jgi:hypothetical protein